MRMAFVFFMVRLRKRTAGDALCTGRRPSLFAFFILAVEALVEAVNASAGIYELLFAGEERVAL